jgi:hypothetical protein
MKHGNKKNMKYNYEQYPTQRRQKLQGKTWMLDIIHLLPIHRMSDKNLDMHHMGRKKKKKSRNP